MAVLMLLFLSLSYYILLLNALESVESISIHVSALDLSTNTAIYLTLWFDSTIYQLAVDGTSLSLDTTHTYTSDEISIIAHSDCSHVTDTKMMIENADSDEIIWDSIKFTTSAGIWYGIDGYCVESYVSDAYVGTGWSYWLSEQPDCVSGYALVYICVDTKSPQPDECGPFKQIFYFDTSKPNQYITDSEWKSGTDITPQLETCPPTAIPTQSRDPILFVYVAGGAVLLILMLTCVLLKLRSPMTVQVLNKQVSVHIEAAGNVMESEYDTDKSDDIGHEGLTPLNDVEDGGTYTSDNGGEDVLKGSLEENEEEEGHHWDNLADTTVTTSGNDADEEQKEDVILDAMLSDILEMQHLDPNKIHQMNLNNSVHQANNNSDSDESDKIYQH